MASLFETLTDAQRARRDELISLLHGIALLRFDFKHELGVSVPHDALKAETHRVFADLVPLTTKTERIEMRGEMSRGDVKNLEYQVQRGEEVPASLLTDAQRAEITELGRGYEYGNYGERAAAELSQRNAKIVSDMVLGALTAERTAIADWLEGVASVPAKVLLQLREGKYPEGDRFQQLLTTMQGLA